MPRVFHVFYVCGRAFLHPVSRCCRPHTLELAGGLTLATVCEALPGASRTPRRNLGDASLAQTATDTTPAVHPGRPPGSYGHVPTWRASPRTSSLPTHPVLCQPAPRSAPLLDIPCTTGPPPPQTSSRLPLLPSFTMAFVSAVPIAQNSRFVASSAACAWRQGGRVVAAPTPTFRRAALPTSSSPVRRTRVTPRAAADSEPVPPEEKEIPFEIRGFSLANVGLALGFAITGYSFFTYFSSNGTASATSLGFVYGVPVLLIGCALKYAELQPVPLTSTPAGLAAREATATDIQKKIVSDVTRHRYGDEAHLAAALRALSLVPRGAVAPELVRAAEATTEQGEYSLALEFFSKETPFKTWAEVRERCERFFGPDVRAEVTKVDGEKRLVELKLISTRKA